MKKFHWRLQRVLDLKVKEEEVLRTQMVELMERAAALRGRIMMLQAMLRSGLMDIRSLPASERIDAQRQFLEYVPFRHRQIAGLNEQLGRLEQERQRKMEAMSRLRKFRKGLEQLRGRAVEEYLRETNREEQKLLDECSGQALMRRRTAEETGRETALSRIRSTK